VLERAKKEWTTFTVLSRKDAAPQGDSNTTAVGELVYRSAEAIPYALDAITTVYLLSICQAFIGYLHTSLGNMAVELQAAKNFTLVPASFLPKDTETQFNGYLHTFARGPVDPRMRRS
jgi:hypothetical protein